MSAEMLFQQENLRDWIAILFRLSIDPRKTPSDRAWAIIELREYQEELGELVRVYGYQAIDAAEHPPGLWPYRKCQIINDRMSL